MIIYRYLGREVLMNMLTVAGVVLVISVGWRFSGYLREAAGGNLTSDILFLIMFYRLPEFLELIIPLSFSLGIMLAYGRLYVDSEMIVLEAAGFSPNRVVWATLTMAAAIMLATGLTSFWLKPLGETRLEQLFKNQRALTEFDTLAPGRFQTLSSGRRVTYTESLEANGDLGKVFINELATVGGAGAKKASTILAAAGSQVVDGQTGDRFLVLRDGARYSGQPGKTDYQIIEYEEYGQLLERERSYDRKRRKSALTTRELWQERSPQSIAELQWRVSIVLLVPIMGLMAIPMSRVNPRQGRFGRLAPGLALSFLYVLLLSVSKSAVDKGQISPLIGLWWVHAAFLAIGFALLKAGNLLSHLRRR